MTNEHPSSRIPHGKVSDDLTSWKIPSLEGTPANGKKKPRKNAKKNPGGAGAITTEKVEDVVGEVKIQPITAGQLQEMSETIEKEAYNKGYQEGLEKGQHDGEKAGVAQGKQQAYAEHSAELDDQRQRLSAISDTLFEAAESDEAMLENIILDMAVGFARHILSHEIALDPKRLFPVVEKAVSALPAGANNIKVFMHPDDAAITRDIAQRSGKIWHVFEDQNLMRGGCRVETEESLVDYSVEKRLADYFAESRENDKADAESLEPVENFRPEPQISTQLPLEQTDSESAYGKDTGIESKGIESKEIEEMDTNETDVEESGIRKDVIAQGDKHDTGQESTAQESTVQAQPTIEDLAEEHSSGFEQDNLLESIPECAREDTIEPTLNDSLPDTDVSHATASPSTLAARSEPHSPPVKEGEQMPGDDLSQTDRQTPPDAL